MYFTEQRLSYTFRFKVPMKSPLLLTPVSQTPTTTELNRGFYFIHLKVSVCMVCMGKNQNKLK